MRNAAILVECGPKYGLGRVRRSLTLARALTDNGVRCTVYLTHQDGKDMATLLGFPAKSASALPSRHDILVLDTASHSAQQVDKLCAAADVSCVIDDLGERPVTCDIVINPNLYARDVDYSAYRAGAILCAPEYTLVHPDFFACGQPDAARSGIVVSFGGTDDGRLAAPIANRLAELSGEPIYVPIPGHFTRRVATNDNWHERVRILPAPDMSALLGHAKLYVGAAGSTVLEALAAGCRICAVATQADQHKNIRHLQRRRASAVAAYDPERVAQTALASLTRPMFRLPSLNRHAARGIATELVGVPQKMLM